MYRTTRMALAAFLVAGTTASAQTALMPPHSNTFTGNTRGYFFTAPTSFRITGVQVLQAPGGTNQYQNWAIVRFHNQTPPPLFNATTNDFDQLAIGLDQPAGSYATANVEVQTGDVIGIYGNTTASPGVISGANSYSPSAAPATTEVLGHMMTLFRSGMQFHLGSATVPNMQDLWHEATNQITRIEFTYAPIDPNAIGACCFPNGDCDFITYASCDTGGGTFQGENVTCAAANCPQPGACCFPNGDCEFIFEAACTFGGGTWSGAHVDCPTANCPQPPTGACCLGGGVCEVMWEGGCNAAQGIYRGDGTDCTTIACPMTLTTTLVGGNSQAGAMFDLTAHENITIIGFDYLSAATSSAAQEIEIYHVTDRTTFEGKDSDPTLWTLIEAVTVQTQVSPLANPVPTHVPISGFTINAGETIGMYFTRNAALATTSIRYTNGPLGAFTTPHLTFEDRGLGKSYPFGSHFSVRVWNGTIYYDLADAPCYANCDGSTTEPILTVDDFTCFINEFAAAQALPPSQQITHYANCDGSTTEPVLTVDDFTCFINEFAAGCP